MVGHVPLIVGRYCADGLSLPPPPELELLALASVTFVPPLEPELPLEPEDEPLEPEDEPLDPELPVSVPPPDPELPLEPEFPELPELLLTGLPPPPNPPGSFVPDPLQLATSPKHVVAIPKTSVHRMHPSGRRANYPWAPRP
jgi:hypothetical protein